METNYIKGASPLTPYPHSFWWFTDEKVLAIMVTADDVLRWSHRSGFFQRVRLRILTWAANTASTVRVVKKSDGAQRITTTSWVWERL